MAFLLHTEKKRKLFFIEQFLCEKEFSVRSMFHFLLSMYKPSVVRKLPYGLI